MDVKESDFRVWIDPIPEDQSDGKWDFRVTVCRLKDALYRTTRVSGGWMIAETMASTIMQEMSSP